MSIYDLNNPEEPKNPETKIQKKPGTFWYFFLALAGALLAGFMSGGMYYGQASDYLKKFNINISGLNQFAGIVETGREKPDQPQEYVPQTTQEQSVIKVVNDYSPAVVSIIISKNVPILEKYYVSPFRGFEQFFGNFPGDVRGEFDPEMNVPQYRQKGTQMQEVGGGSGFFVTSDGLILTNKHVVSDDQAKYTVYTLDGSKYEAKVLATDPVQDLALIKIEGENFPTVKLGDSSKIQIGQSVIAIGNALGEFNNTVSVGVISGLSRTITASGSGMAETLEDIIQTDAAINEGNSGGPLFNLMGEVIGVNTAMAGNAQNIGFAIPISRAVRDIEQVKTSGKIIYPFLGVNYVVIDDQVQKDNSLPVNYGAWILASQQSGSSAVVAGSAADKAGLKEKDIILEFNGEQITAKNSLARIISKYNPGDEVTLKIMRDGKTLDMTAVMGERQ